MKVGVIGLGDHAQQVYLPVLTTQPGVRLHLHSRSRSVLDEVAARHHVPAERRFDDLDALLGAGLDAAFVLAPTDAPAPLATRLLEAGTPVHVDRALADTFDAARRVVDLATARGVGLAVGFHRRFAPGYAQCLEHPRELILLQQHRVGLPEEPRRAVFGDFLPVVDTLRFLAPGPVDHVTAHGRVRDGLLHHVVLQLAGDGFTAVGAMNRLSGSAEEILEVSGQDTKREVRNLAEVIDHKGQPSVRRRGDWVPVARQRGVEQSVTVFLDAVRSGRPLSAEDALRTHELCERVTLDVQDRPW